MAVVHWGDGARMTVMSTSERRGGRTGACAFCAIAAGDSDAHVVWQSQGCIAFLDHRPLFAGHVLVIPRDHVVTLPELSDVRELFAAVQLLAAAVPAAMRAQGSFVANNNIVSQSVPHLHVHVVPRVRGDGLRGFFWPRRRYAEGEASAVAAAIRGAVAARREHG